MRKPPSPIFIVGCARSGTTLTAQLLSRLPRVHIARETGYISQNAGLIRQVDEPSSLTGLIRVVNDWLRSEQWRSAASERGFREFCDRNQISGPAAFLHYVWQLDSPVPWDELDYIGDNTPLYMASIPLLLEFFPEARFIHVVRDPRDVVCSVKDLPFGAHDPLVAAMEWHVMMGCWLLGERLVPSQNRLEFRYEDLCSAPLETLQAVVCFLGRAESEADLILSHESGGHFETVAQQPHHEQLGKPVSRSRIGRYRKELTVRQLKSIEGVLQYGLMAYGYPLDDWDAGVFVRSDRIAVGLAVLRDILKHVLRRIRRIG